MDADDEGTRMAYEFTWHARSSSIDETDHLYYPELFRLLDEGIEALLEEVGYPLSRLILDEEFALPIVHVEADYLAPVTLGDAVACRIDPEPGESSIRFRGTGAVDDERVFEATIVRVFVDETFEKRPLPGEIREALERV